MSEQEIKELYDRIQLKENEDTKYQMNFMFFQKYGKIKSITSLEEGLETITK